nr:HAD family phosphatase [uncultured Agrobacterium sp.]
MKSVEGRSAFFLRIIGFSCGEYVVIKPERHSDDKLIVFDVGGVFIELNVEKRKAAFAAGGRWSSTDQANTNLLHLNMQFRLGQIDEDTYLHRASEMYGLTAEQILQAETALLEGVFNGMVDYVRTLKSSHRVVCLSNTQSIHWRHIIETMLGAELFDACYLSHEMGMEKPGEEIYLAVQNREQVSPERIVFIDDTLENIATSRRLGWHSIHHVDAAKTIAAIDEAISSTPQSGTS